MTTSFDQQGFPTVVPVVPGANDQPKSFDSQGFLVTSAGSGAQPTGDVAQNLRKDSGPLAANGAVALGAGSAVRGAGVACAMLGGLLML